MAELFYPSGFVSEVRRLERHSQFWIVELGNANGHWLHSNSIAMHITKH